MKRKSWLLGVLFVLLILVSYLAKPEKTQNDLLLMNIEALACLLYTSSMDSVCTSISSSGISITDIGRQMLLATQFPSVLQKLRSVSYTHLDVYKRQVYGGLIADRLLYCTLW